MLNSPRNTHLIETSTDRTKSKEITFQQYRNVPKQEFSDRFLNIHEHKRYYYTLIIHYYLLRAFRTLHKSFHAKSRQRPVSSVSAPGRWHNAIRVRAKPCVHRFNYSRTLPRRGFPVGAVDIVNPGIQ